MGKVPHNKSGGKRRHVLNKSAARLKFLRKGDDQAWDQLHRQAEIEANGEQPPSLPVDEDLPGLGQHYCMACDRHFASKDVLADHCKSKPHRRRLKMLSGPDAPHCQADAEAAAGMGPTDNGPLLRGGQHSVAMAL